MSHGIVTIDTNFVRPFLDASHLIIENGKAAFVDTGTNHSISYLLDSLILNDLDTKDVEYVFITHVHLDHAGGAGKLMKLLPNAKLVIHPRGSKHLEDPSRLIASSKTVYGEKVFFNLYGDIEPIPFSKMIIVDDEDIIYLQKRPLRCFYTEGHARHHYCIYDEHSKSIFSGDSFGVSYRELDTMKGAFIFPTTSPTQFDPHEAHKAIDKILTYNPQTIYLTHYSRVSSVNSLADDLHFAIDKFVEIAKRYKASAMRTKEIRLAMSEFLIGSLKAHESQLSDQEALKFLEVDIKVNTMGLECWLDQTG